MKEINICFASDDGYAMHLGIAIYSLIVNLNKEYFANIFILDWWISDFNKNKILESVKDFKNINIKYIEIDWDKYNNFNACNISKETYFRIDIANIFKNIDKIIYIDVDVIVNGDISNIFKFNLNKKVLWAVYEITTRFHYKKLFNIPNKNWYFNAWVLFINLEEMRKNDYSTDIISYINKNNNKLIACDQDALNWVLYDKRIKLPPKFNALPFIFFSRNYRVLWYSKEEFKEARNNPVIIHFAGEKPWNKYCWHPMKYKYFEYKKQTAFKDINLQVKKQSFLNHLVYNIIIFLLANIPEKIYNLIYIFKKV